MHDADIGTELRSTDSASQLLTMALVEYVERYGLTEKARRALSAPGQFEPRTRSAIDLEWDER